MWPATGSIGSDLAAEALRRAGVEQHAPRRRPRRHPRVSPSRGARTKSPGSPPSSPARERPAVLAPAGQAAVEHRHRLVAEVAQQPPEPCRAALARLVVGHDARAGADPGAARRGLEVRAARAAGGGRARPAVAREVARPGRGTPRPGCGPRATPAGRRPAPRARSGSPRPSGPARPGAPAARTRPQSARSRRSLGPVRAMVLPHAPGPLRPARPAGAANRAPGRCSSR